MAAAVEAAAAEVVAVAVAAVTSAGCHFAVGVATAAAASDIRQGCMYATLPLVCEALQPKQTLVSASASILQLF